MPKNKNTYKESLTLEDYLTLFFEQVKKENPKFTVGGLSTESHKGIKKGVMQVILQAKLESNK